MAPGRQGPAAAWPPGEVIAHRGGALEAAENTVAAVRHGVACGSHWQEVDLTLSRDDEVVVIHDDRLERTTDGHGHVADRPWSELCRLTARAAPPTADQLACLARWGAPPPAGAPVSAAAAAAAASVPRLGDVLAVAGSQLMLELKDGPRPGRLVERVAAALVACGRRRRLALASFSPDILAAAARSLPEVPRIGIAEDTVGLEAVAALSPLHLAVSKDLLPAARGCGARLWTWTVCCAAEAQALFAAGADGVITDAPRAVLAGPAAAR